MSWEILLKAQFLPGNNAKRWAEVLESEQSLATFTRQLMSGDYKTVGINATIKFLKEDKFDNLISSLFARDIEEDEAKGRYDSLKPLLLQKLREKNKEVKGGRETEFKIVSIDGFLENLDKFVKSISANRRPIKRLRSLEIFIRQHPEIVKKQRNELREKYLEIIGPWLERNEGIMGATKLQPLTVIRRERAQERGLSEAEFDPKGIPDYRFTHLFRLVRGQKAGIEKKTYALEEITWDKTATFYKDVVSLHRDLIPDNLYESNLVVKKGGWRLNPYLNLLFENNNLEEAAANMNAGVKDALYNQIGEGTDRRQFDSTLERLFDVKDRIYSEEFADWLTAREWKFEDGYLIYEEDGDVERTADRFSTKDQQALENTRFKDEGEFKILVGSDETIQLVERIWHEATRGELSDLLMFDPRAIEAFREASFGLVGTIEQFTPGPISTTFGRSNEDLLRVLHVAGQAFGLGDGGPSREYFTTLYDDLQEALQKSAETKLQEIVKNQTRYREIRGLFDKLVKLGLIREENV